MLNPQQDPRREIIAALMCSRLYFDLALWERLALIKSLCGLSDRRPGPLTWPAAAGLGLNPRVPRCCRAPRGPGTAAHRPRPPDKLAGPSKS